MTFFQFLIGLLSIGILFLISIVESAVGQLSRLTLRVTAEKHPQARYRLLHEAARNRRDFLLPIVFAGHLLMVFLAVGASYLGTFHGVPSTFLIVFGVMAVVLLLFRHVLPNLVSKGREEAVLLHLLPSFRPLYTGLRLIALPILWLNRLLNPIERPPDEEFSTEEETTEEEIQAYLGVGEEEGIFESSESELIQSALEFGSTLVREIMTPRNDIVAVDEKTSIAELKDLIASAKHSRIPVYRENLDQIVGIVYVRNLLSHLQVGSEAKSIRPLLNEVPMVPESKRVFELLKQMQARAEQMAIVVNEYGTVSGLVTIEDLLEEIVGEIRDEDESRRADIVNDGEGGFLVRGGFEVDKLEEVLGVEFGEHSAATISGLVVDHLGVVPAAGEVIYLDGVSLQVLSSDRKRIHSLRVRRLDLNSIGSSTESGSHESSQ